jgi:hypothetical protein
LETQNNVDVSNILEKKKKEISIRNIPLSTEVWVSNNCYNELNYISKNTGFRSTWDNFGNPQPMSLEELLIMRNTQRKFFERPWIKINGFIDSDYNEIFSVEEILDFLQVKQYYKNSLCPDNIDEIFKLSTEEIEKRVPNMSSGTKATIVVRANDLVEKGELDSLKVILTLEKILNCEIIRPKVE